jgi:lipoprotein
MNRSKIFEVLLATVILFAGCGGNQNEYALPSVPQEEIVITKSFEKPDKIKLYEKGKILSLSEEQADEIWSALDIIFNSAYETLGTNDSLEEKDLEEWKKTEISLELLYHSNQIQETSFGLDRYYGVLMILEEDGIRYVRYREGDSEERLHLSSRVFNIFYSGKEFTIQYTKLLRKVMELI